jgi:hypothetical protein
MTSPENSWIPFDAEHGRSYREALQIVRDWTKLNHEVIHRLVQEKMGDASLELQVAISTLFGMSTILFFEEKQTIHLVRRCSTTQREQLSWTIIFFRIRPMVCV